MALNQVTVSNPSNNSSSDGTTVTALAGKAGEQVVTNLRGKYYTSNYRGTVFTFNRTAVTVPVIAATLVSVFSLWNPPGSGKNAELISFDYGIVLATTVVDVVGLYYSSGSLALAGTFTTAGTALSGSVGSTAANVVLPYSAYTHSGTPTRHSILGFFGAVTTTNSQPAHLDFDGRVIVPPGTVVSIAMSTAASTTSGVDLGLTWAEVPV